MFAGLSVKHIKDGIAGKGVYHRPKVCILKMQPLFIAAHSNSRGTSQAQWSFSPLEGSWCSPEGTELSAGVTGLSGHLCQNEEKNHLHVFSSCFFGVLLFSLLL